MAIKFQGRNRFNFYLYLSHIFFKCKQSVHRVSIVAFFEYNKFKYRIIYNGSISKRIQLDCVYVIRDVITFVEYL